MSAFASQLSLSFLQAIFPAMLVGLTVLGFFVDAKMIVDKGFALVNGAIPPQVLSLIEKNIQEIWVPGSVGVFSLGFVVLLYTVESLLRQTMSILNVIYGVGETRHLFKRVLLALLALVGILVLILSVIQLLFVTDELLLFVEKVFGWSINFGFLIWRWPLVLFLLFGFVYLSYLFLPNLKKHYWKLQIPGAVCFTTGWLVMSLLFNFYVSNFADYNKTYGVLGAIILLLFYLQLNAYLYIVCAGLNASLITTRFELSFWQRVKRFLGMKIKDHN